WPRLRGRILPNLGWTLFRFKPCHVQYLCELGGEPRVGLMPLLLRERVRTFTLNQPMHDQTSSAMETVTLFAANASANAAVAAERERVERLARQLRLDRARLSAVDAVMTWAAFLRPSTDQADRERLRTYLDVMGYLPADRKIVANAERRRHAVDAAVPALLDGFAKGDI